MILFLKKVHLYGAFRKLCFFLINRIFTGTASFSCCVKRRLLRMIGCPVGKGTTIVSPIMVFGTIDVGENCWINRGFVVHGNGNVSIGNNCDFGPNVSVLTGGHQIGDSRRRAGLGETYDIVIGDGVWVGANSTILGNTIIEAGCVIAACSCVTQNVPRDCLYGGVPAKLIRSLNHDDSRAD